MSNKLIGGVMLAVLALVAVVYLRKGNTKTNASTAGKGSASEDNSYNAQIEGASNAVSATSKTRYQKAIDGMEALSSSKKSDVLLIGQRIEDQWERKSFWGAYNFPLTAFDSVLPLQDSEFMYLMTQYPDLSDKFRDKKHLEHASYDGKDASDSTVNGYVSKLTVKMKDVGLI